MSDDDHDSCMSDDTRGSYMSDDDRDSCMFADAYTGKMMHRAVHWEKYENKTLNNCLDDVDKSEKIAVVIGPEGGFSQNEFEYFVSQEYKLITLGKMIYKAPNAVTVAISNIVSRIE